MSSQLTPGTIDPDDPGSISCLRVVQTAGLLSVKPTYRLSIDLSQRTRLGLTYHILARRGNSAILSGGLSQSAHQAEQRLK